MTSRIPSTKVRSRSAAFAFFAAMLFASGCSAYVIPYKQVCFEEENGLTVIERSPLARDSQGKPLTFATSDLPVRARLERPEYSVLIDTPQGSGIPVVFLNVVAPDGRALDIEGKHVRHVHPDAVGYSHSFYVREANGAPLEMVIRDPTGRVLGSETLRYRIRTAGVVYGIEGV
jgi:hypothetical protein